ncbi:hypothetical protein J4450_05150 [Candidatus Micrarchaeota archaeon]|nr:hypothetical protein [Candidatus Micrarchaeota archaeon]
MKNKICPKCKKELEEVGFAEFMNIKTKETTCENLYFCKSCDNRYKESELKE